MEYHWKTNFFQLKEGIKVGESLFGADVIRDQEGRIQIYSYEGSEPCWLSDDLINCDAWEIESLGLDNVSQLNNYDEEQEAFEDLNGFYLMDFLVPEGEIITAIELRFSRRFMHADGYLWRQGMGSENIWLRFNYDIAHKAVEEFGVDPDNLHWLTD